MQTYASDEKVASVLRELATERPAVPIVADPPVEVRPAEGRVVIVDVQIPFWRAVWLTFSFAIVASISAALYRLIVSLPDIVMGMRAALQAGTK